MIPIEGLRKTYGEVTAVDGLDLTVEAGRITALLGPNGAGKTTTVNCIVGLVAPDRGRILIGGIDAVADPVAAKKLFAYVPEVASLYHALTQADKFVLVPYLAAVSTRRRT